MNSSLSPCNNSNKKDNLEEQQEEIKYYQQSNEVNNESYPFQFKKSIIKLNDNIISSRGCSRIFILLVLKEALFYCKSLLHSPDFPFENSLVKIWLNKVKLDCITLLNISSSKLSSSSSSLNIHNNNNNNNDNDNNSNSSNNNCSIILFSNYSLLFGGVEFSSNNSSSYWTEPKQFFTWWKNNIERKNKFQNLIRDSETITNEKSLFRAFYCRNVIDLTNNIRNHFERNRVNFGPRSLPGPQVTPPTFEEFCIYLKNSQKLYIYSTMINNPITKFLNLIEESRFIIVSSQNTVINCQNLQNINQGSHHNDHFNVRKVNILDDFHQIIFQNLQYHQLQEQSIEEVELIQEREVVVDEINQENVKNDYEERNEQPQSEFESESQTISDNYCDELYQEIYDTFCPNIDEDCDQNYDENYKEKDLNSFELKNHNNFRRNVIKIHEIKEQEGIIQSELDYMYLNESINQESSLSEFRVISSSPIEVNLNRLHDNEDNISYIIDNNINRVDLNNSKKLKIVSKDYQKKKKKEINYCKRKETQNKKQKKSEFIVKPQQYFTDCKLNSSSFFSSTSSKSTSPFQPLIAVSPITTSLDINNDNNNSNNNFNSLPTIFNSCQGSTTTEFDSDQIISSQNDYRNQNYSNHNSSTLLSQPLKVKSKRGRKPKKVLDLHNNNNKINNNDNTTQNINQTSFDSYIHSIPIQYDLSQYHNNLSNSSISSFNEIDPPNLSNQLSYDLIELEILANDIQMIVNNSKECHEYEEV